eukprot:231372-Prymnesium_polylepis.1
MAYEAAVALEIVAQRATLQGCPYTRETPGALHRRHAAKVCVEDKSRPDVHGDGADHSLFE